VNTEECTCGHSREAHASGAHRCIDWHGADLRACDCARYVESGIWPRMLGAADIASRTDASVRRELNAAAGMYWTQVDRARRLNGEPPSAPDDADWLVTRVADALRGWGYVAALALQWMLTVVVVVAAAGCSSSHAELDAGDAAYSADTSAYVDSSADVAELDAGDVAELEAACRRAAIAYEGADFRLGCHRVSSCCTLLHDCPAHVDVDACVRAREGATSCAELEAPACAFAPTFPEGGP
jgi:hypothetical protein